MPFEQHGAEAPKQLDKPSALVFNTAMSEPTGSRQLPEEAAAEHTWHLLRSALPWSISALLHLVIILSALFTVWAVTLERDDNQQVVPVARLHQPARSELKLRQVDSARISRSAITPPRPDSLQRPDDALLDRPQDPTTKLIGVFGALDQRRANPFGLVASRPQQTQAHVFGVGGNALRLVYVIDASGSLVDSLEFVIAELKRSISDLTDQQRFAVIFFQGERAPLEVPPRGLRPATPQRKAAVKKWIDLDSGNIAAAGTTNPVPAIKLALKYRPQLIILLSDNITGQGIYEIEQKQLLGAIEQANRHGTKISTIQFLHRDPLEASGLAPTMKLIAERNGGRYRFVDEQELVTP